MNKRKWMLICLSIPAILVGIYYVMHQDIYRGVTNFGFVALLALPLIIEKIAKCRFGDWVYYLYISFMFLAAFLGAGLSFYQMISWYDVLMHTLSGTLTGLLGYMLLTGLKLDKVSPTWFHALFLVMVSLSVASCWEFYEYFVDLISGKDAQNVLLTGVADTMQDMLVAFVGTLPISAITVMKPSWLDAFRGENLIVRTDTKEERKAS